MAGEMSGFRAHCRLKFMNANKGKKKDKEYSRYMTGKENVKI